MMTPKDDAECRADFATAFPGKPYPGYVAAFRALRLETARRIANKEPPPWVGREPGEDDGDETEAHWTDR